MKLLIALTLAVSLVSSAHALELKLDDAWLPKLGQLCDAARYAARMAAEPICNDLAVLAQKAQAEDQAAKAAADKPKQDPPAK